jgi:sugar lactone lactonase YvrE
MNQILQYNHKKNFSLLSIVFFLNAKAQVVSTFAGSTAGFADGTATAAKFSGPYGVAVDAAGNVYLADSGNNRIRKITAAGVVSTLAGSGVAGFAEGAGNTAQFDQPFGVAVDAAGNVIVGDTGNNRIRKITAAGVVSTLAGSIEGNVDATGSAAQFNRPGGVAIDAAGTVFVADAWNHLIREISAAGVVSTLAGSTLGFADGTGTAAQFNYPEGVAVDAAGNVYIADGSNNRIRKITSAGVVSTLAGSTQGYGDGTGAAAQFHLPIGVAADAAGNVFVADDLNHRIRIISPSGVVTSAAGSGIAGFADGAGTSAKFGYPHAVAADASGNIFVADTNNNRIRKITGTLGTASYQPENQVLVYPNPATSIINVESGDISGGKVVLFDLNGRALQSKNIVGYRSAIDINGLADGIYLMEIHTERGMVCRKIVKR